MMKKVLFPEPWEGVRTKICGIRSLQQAEDIVDLGVDALGINFWPKSKRYLDPADAGWLKDLGTKVLRIGVFVNADESEIRNLLESDLIDWAQLHGDESPEFVKALQDEGLQVFKALGVKDRESLAKAERFDGPLLLDAYAPTEYGGSGEKMDWALGAEAVQRFPNREVVLAGGLKPDNVAAAIRQVGPTAVDVASGVEDSPGVKNLELCREFIEAASL